VLVVLGAGAMGIKGLNVWIHSTFPGVMCTVNTRGSTPYDHVLFDLNGIVHQACRRKGNEKDVLKSVVSDLDALLRLFPARRTVLVALDGPGPTAKLVEQRRRRIDKVLKAARDAEAAIPGSREALRRAEIALMEGRELGQPKKKRKTFDSLQVTPGTTFMLRLRRCLEWWAASRLVGGAQQVLDPRAPKPLIFVSAADVPGEGEVKLLEHLHAVSRDAPPAAPPESFLLVGPDADLLLLGLASGQPRCAF
jgi:5'-3' exonuclease